MTDDPALRLAVDTICGFEGFRSHPYGDVTGVWTIGYGSTYLLDGSRVTESTLPIDELEARALMTMKVGGQYLPAVRQMVCVPITINQAAALCSFAYNLGTAALRNSTLMHLLNSRHFSDAADQFGAWVHAGGRVVAGLVNRRTAEKALFLKPDAPA